MNTYARLKTGKIIIITHEDFQNEIFYGREINDIKIEKYYHSDIVLIDSSLSVIKIYKKYNN